MARILIVEDDLDINNMLNALLVKNGHESHVAYSGSEAALLLKAERFDLILLDLMLPGRSGLEVLAELRATGDDTPVVMLTAVTDKESVVTLLTAGANDYLTKPFDNRELLARVRVQLRSGEAGGADDRGDRGTGDRGTYNLSRGSVTDYTSPCHPVGHLPRPSVSAPSHKNLTLDVELFDAVIGGCPAGLSKTEYSILKLLMSNPRKVFTKDNLYASVWGGTFMGDDNTINVHISKLRAKLAALDSQTDYITTVWGIGFKMS